MSDSNRPEPRPCSTCGKPVEPYYSDVVGWVSVRRHDDCVWQPPRPPAPSPKEQEVGKLLLAAGFFERELADARQAMAGDLADPLTLPDALAAFGEVSNRFALHVHGQTSSGKTCRVIVWAALYLQREIERGEDPKMLYTTERELIDAVMWSRTEDKRPLSHYIDPSVLVIDECGQTQKPWSIPEFLEIINQRHRRGHLTLTVSQWSLEELHERSLLWQDAVMTRLLQDSGGQQVSLPARNWREEVIRG